MKTAGRRGRHGVPDTWVRGYTGREGGGVTCVRVMNEDCGSEGASRCTRYLG